MWRGSSSTPSRSRPAHLAAMDRDVLHAGLRIARDHQAGGDVGAAVVLVVGRQRQQRAEIDVAMHDLLHRRRRHLLPRQRIERAASWKRASTSPGSTPIASAIQARLRDEAGDDRHLVAVRARETSVARAPSSRLAIAASSKRSADLVADHREPVARRQMIEPVAQGPDRRRRIAPEGFGRRNFHSRLNLGHGGRSS